MATTTNYEIDYNDQRFQNVNADKQQALQQSNQQYDQMIGQSDQYYQSQIDAVKQYEQKQSQLQQEQTDFTIEQINQQKDQAKKDYTKEQQAAYVDWQKQSDQYGANAEQMAAQGMQGTGFSESSQVQMYTAYQNRVATAKESYNNAVLNYDNGIKEARLANSSALAEISFNSLQEQLTLGLQGFQYKNDLTTQKMDTQRQIDSEYYNRWQDVQAQINQENAMAEQIRQYNESMAEDKRQYDTTMAYQKDRDAVADQQWEAEFGLSERQFEESLKQWAAEFGLSEKQFLESVRQYDQNFAYQQERDTVADDQWLQTFNEGVRQYDASLAEDKRQYDKSLAEDKRQYNKSLAEDKRQFNVSQSSSGSSTKSSGSSSKSSGNSSGENNKKINKNGNNNSKENEPKIEDNGAYTTAKNKKFTSTQQTNIANSLMKNSTKENKAKWKAQIDKWYKAGTITKKQRSELMETVG